MCGIGGVLIYPRERTEYELEYIRLLASGIAVENQVRGRDSTGIAVFNRKEENFVLKNPMSAREFVNTTTFKRFVGSNITKHTKNILIHTRAGTKGTELNNDNNHPIVSQKYIGVHNGMIWNDDSLFKSESLFRQAEVDSEVIFRLLDKYGQTLDGMKKVAETINGSYTFATISKQRQNEVYLVKHNNPITMVYIPEFHIIAFASERKFLENAITETSLEFNFEQLIDTERATWFEPLADTILRFDVLQNNPLTQMAQEALTFKSSHSYYYEDEYDWYNSSSYGRGYYIDGPKKNEKEEEMEAKETLIRETMRKLTEKELILLESEIELQTDKSWNLGYDAGRKSLAEELEQARSFAFEKGYEKGQDDGYEEGWIDRASGRGSEKVIGALPEPKEVF